MASRTVDRDAAVLTLLRDRNATRPQIADETGMSKPTVSAAIAALEQVGLVRQDGQIVGATGRSPVVYSLNATARLVVGIDVGGVNTRAAIADLRGTILIEQTELTRSTGVTNQVSDIIGRLRARVARQLNCPRPQLAAIVLSTPGVIAADGTVRLAYNVDSAGSLNYAPLKARLRAPLRIENNVNLAAIGEHRLGAARHVKTFLQVSVGAGIGVGTIYDGRLLRGHNGAAGEISYLPIGAKPLGAQLETGNYESVTAAAGLLQRAQSKSWPDRPPHDVAELFTWAAEGDATARKLVADEGTRIGLAVVAARAIVDPELVVLGGGIGRNELLVAPVAAVSERLLPVPCPIVTTELADRGSLIGAVVSAADDAWQDIMNGLGATADPPAPHSEKE
ncbi:MAG: ROK family transcriptional regulator [Nakamurella sp.]